MITLGSRAGDTRSASAHAGDSAYVQTCVRTCTCTLHPGLPIVIWRWAGRLVGLDGLAVGELVLPARFLGYQQWSTVALFVPVVAVASAPTRPNQPAAPDA